MFEVNVVLSDTAVHSNELNGTKYTTTTRQSLRAETENEKALDRILVA